MSELCNNSACFSVEIKGTSDIYSSSKSLMISEHFAQDGKPLDSLLEDVIQHAAAAS